MNKIIRYWNQNRKQIIIVIAIIAFIIIMLRVINNLAKQTNKSNNNTNSISKVTDLQKPTKSTITGQNVPETVTKENTDIIKTFVDYCNNNQEQKSYELLSNDCKEEFNNNINVFINDYYNRIFKTKKTYNLELLYTEAGSYTYKITYYEDNLLATGGTGANNNFEDYITIINQDGERKLNINNFIKNQEINKTQVTNNIEITIKSKKVYRSYEQYKITIKNNNSTTILLSDGKNSEDICLLDKNDTKYVAFLHEIPEYNLLLRVGRTTELNISFNKIYAPTRVIEKVQFSNITLNQETNTKTSITIKI